MQNISVEIPHTVEHIPLSKIDGVLFNFRNVRRVKRDFESEEFEQLKRSIDSQGILQPVQLVRNSNGTYSIVDGSRRIKASRQLGRKEIASNVLEQLGEIELITIAISQNLHRLSLSVEETTNAIIDAAKILYPDITEEQIKSKAKQIHNNTANKDKIFQNMIEHLGFAGNSVYQFMQAKVQLTAKTYQVANEINLTLPYRILLTKGPLKYIEEKKDEYDLIEQRQLDLLQKIAGRPLRRAQEITTATLNYIEESLNSTASTEEEDEDEDVNAGSVGAPTGGGGGGSGRGRKKGTSGIVSTVDNYLDLMSATKEFLRRGTGYTLSKGPKFYDLKKHIKTLDSENFRRDIVDNMAELDCKALRHELNLAGHMIDSFMKMIDAKYPAELDKYR